MEQQVTGEACMQGWDGIDFPMRYVRLMLCKALF